MNPGQTIWNTLCLVLFFLALGMYLKTCETTYQDYTSRDKIDSMYKVITEVESRIDSLNIQKRKLVSEEKTIHEESTKTIERILLASDSSQHFITEELIGKHKQLDSIK
jgi:hypothetical protein